MESLNLNTLASSLPTAYQNAEKELMSDFKAAALSITTFYRSSRNASKRAYNAGYSSACQDLLTMIQQGVSVGGIDASGGAGPDDGMSIGKVMDWIEARLQAIKSREEEEDEDDEREKERDRVVRPSAMTPKAPSTVASVVASQPFPGSLPPGSSSAPSLPPPTTARTMQPPQTPVKASKLRAKEASETSQGERFSLASPSAANIEPLPLVGTKRRHAMMVMLDSASSPLSISPSPASGAMPPPSHPTSVSSSTRRRTRSSRNHASLHQNQNAVHPAEAMDVEEDGRDRKRVARR